MTSSARVCSSQGTTTVNTAASSYACLLPVGINSTNVHNNDNKREQSGSDILQYCAIYCCTISIATENEKKNISQRNLNTVPLYATRGLETNSVCWRQSLYAWLMPAGFETESASVANNHIHQSNNSFVANMIVTKKRDLLTRLRSIKLHGRMKLDCSLCYVFVIKLVVTYTQSATAAAALQFKSPNAQQY